MRYVKKAEGTPRKKYYLTKEFRDRVESQRPLWAIMTKITESVHKAKQDHEKRKRKVSAELLRIRQLRRKSVLRILFKAGISRADMARIVGVSEPQIKRLLRAARLRRPTGRPHTSETNRRSLLFHIEERLRVSAFLNKS
ncbi:MAG TPA: hypothetical protein VGP72_16630 [Planctomycetota bacterium]|jgi:DNA-directed RNA polymerase specialized sigma subunit